MTMDVKQAELEITVIRKIMEDSRRAVYNNSMQGIFWFTLTAIAVLINYLILVTGIGLKFSGLVWLMVIAVGIIFSIRIAKKEKKQLRVKTFAARILASIGIAVGIANTLFSFASVFAHAFDPFIIVPMNSMILGMAFYVISVIQQLKTFKIISLLWWAGSVYFFVFPGIHSLLFIGVMLIVSAWIPWSEEKRSQTLQVQ